MRSNQSHRVAWVRTLTMCVVILTASLASAGSLKMAKDLEGKKGSEPVDVIVQFTQPPTARHHQKVLSKGGTLKNSLGLVSGGSYSVPATALATLAADPEVAYITPDRPLHGKNNGSPTAELDYHTDTVNAPIAWAQGLDGTGIGVAVIDSGIIDIPDFHGQNNRVVFAQNFVGGTSGSANDQYGHGSHVAGIIGGSGNKSSGSNYFYTFKGVAPNVSLIDLRVLDQNGVGTDSRVIAAIQMAIQLKSKYNIRVINLSLGRTEFESYTVDPLCQAVEAAYRAGIVVVVAAGNDGRDNSAGTNGYGTITAPANDPYVITVGAMKTMGTPSRADDEITTYSSKGPTLIDHIVKPDLVAPGNRIVSLYTAGLNLNHLYPGNEIPNSLYQTNGNSTASDTYYVLSGTSMAAPVVSGAVALMLQKSPRLNPDQVKARLMKTASKTFPAYTSYTDPTTGITYTSPYDAFTIGAGYLDIQAALSSTDLSSGVAKSPTAQYDPATNSVYFVNDSSAMWGNSALWGSSAVWGANVFVGSQSALWGSSAMWGNSAVWGSSSTQGFSALWGSSAMWGNSTADGGESELLINGEN